MSKTSSDLKQTALNRVSDPSPARLQMTSRLNHEPPAVTSQLGWRYHHVGIPSTVVRAGETHLPRFGVFVAGFRTSPFGIEWMRFEPDSPIPELIRTVPHVAFEVDDLDAALEGLTVIYPPGSPSDGVRSAMIVYNGAPVELICFRSKEQPASPPPVPGA